MGMLMMDLAVALVLVVLTAGQAVSMVVGEVLMVAMEVNLLDMGDMLELWEDPTEEILP
jgi:hypothetical protein